MTDVHEAAAYALQELLTTPEGRADPYPRYERVRAAGSVVRAGDQFLAVLGHAEVDQALRDPRLRVADVEYMDRRWPEWGERAATRALSRSILETNSPDHERVRRMIAGTFTPRRLSGLRETIEKLCAGLIAEMAGAGEVDFLTAFAYPLPVSVICELLGVPESDRGLFRQLGHDLTATVEPNAPDADAADAASDELLDYFTHFVAAKRRQPGDDLTSALLATHDADPTALSAGELMSNLTLLLVAGFETTTNLLGNGLWLLMSRPDVVSALRSDPLLVSPIVEEILRFDSPVQLTSRVVMEPMEVLGVDLPEDSEVFLMIGAANRDPRRFVAAGEFDPYRGDNSPLSFGSGAHYCVGAALARMEAHVAFPALFGRLPGLGAAGEPVRKDRVTLRGFAEMPISV